MAKPNYSFAKRQRDLAKEQKKEEKLQRKNAALTETTAEGEPSADETPETDQASSEEKPAN